MPIDQAPFTDLISEIIDNRGRTCPTVDHGVPLIATNCVVNDRLFPVHEKLRYVSEKTYLSWFRGHPIPGDIIFVCKGSPGNVAIAPDPVGFCIAQDMVAVRADPRAVYPRFLFAALRSPLVQSRINNLHVGTLIPHFKKGDFDKLLIPMPDKATQVLIGDMYYELSAKIEANERLAEACDRLANAELSRLLQTSEEDGTLITSKLGDVADVNLRTVKPAPGTLTYLDISSVSVGKARPPTRMAWADAPSRARRGVASGDVLWSTVRPNRRSHCLLLDPPKDLVVSTGFAVLTPKQVGPSFLYGISERQEFVDYLISVADGSAYPAVRADRFSEAPILLPTRDALDSYESSTIILRERGAAAHRESNLLLQLRDVLLRNLLSGVRAVSSDESLAKEEV
jgi:type I restriction enzyme S subunit